MPQRVATLASHHAALSNIIVVAIPIITCSKGDADIDALRRLRTCMVEALVDYQRFVHHDVLQPAMAQPHGRQRGSAADLKASCIKLQGDYEAFRLRWSHRSVIDNWYEYRLSALRMIAQFRDHLQMTSSAPMDWAVTVDVGDLAA